VQLRRAPDRALFVQRCSRMRRSAQRRNGVLLLIAVFRIAKGLLLVLAGIAALRLLSGGTAGTVRRWVEALPFAGEHRFLTQLASKVLSMPRSRKELAAVAAFAYALLFFTEGIGLWLQKVWAEYLTIVATGSFIPFEIYEVAKKVSVVRVTVLILNIAIVVFLIRRRLQAHRS
jgi:uncharacterized membrane protein (DUF2068 family)